MRKARVMTLEKRQGNYDMSQENEHEAQWFHDIFCESGAQKQLMKTVAENLQKEARYSSCNAILNNKKHILKLHCSMSSTRATENILKI